MRAEQKQIIRLFRKLLAQSVYRFPEEGKRLEAPETQGVYIIINSDGQVVHVGRTLWAHGGLRQRLYDHIRGRSSFVDEYLNGNGASLRGMYSFQFLEIPKPRERALLEFFAIGCLCPIHIGLGKKQNDEF